MTLAATPACLWVVLAACAAAQEGDVKGEDKAAGKSAAPERKPNRLALEKSPYLLQHAHNPVDWFPWGREAFEQARRDDKPVFLSIGYATCHWCHVMERESFENEAIAAYLNEHFVSVKVDREERPDVDNVYMAACLAQTGNGGWPLTAFLTADGKPFFTGTYFPPEDDPRRGRGFLSILKQIQQLWKEQRKDLIEHADSFTAALGRSSRRAALTDQLDPRQLRAAFDGLRGAHDDQRGGFGVPGRWEPKFPRTSTLDFLLRYAQTAEARADGTSAAALQMVETTLGALVTGGIRDHLQGGFHRYSTDRQWLVPHFEKMLYDQALIARTLCDAWRLTRKAVYRDVALETLDYVLARMRSPGGAFYSAEDADTQGVEGLTYVWRRAEVLEILGTERGERFAELHGMTPEGNFEEAGPGACVLSIAFPGGAAALAQKLGLPADALERDLRDDRARLLVARLKRPQPLRDDKILAEWNGLTLSALSHVHQISGERRYLDAARQAAAFILEKMVVEGNLRRRHREGEAAVDAFLEDHAAMVEGLIDLYESSFETRWLEAAVGLGRAMLSQFWDDKDGGFFSSGRRNEALVVNNKEFYDGAVPAGNSVAFLALLRLEELTGDEAFVRAAKRMSTVAAGILSAPEEGEISHPYLLCGAVYWLLGAREVVIAGPLSDPVVERMVVEARQRFLPARVLLHVAGEAEAAALAKLVPLVEGKGPIGGKATAFVCRRGVCKLPARDVEAMLKALGE